MAAGESKIKFLWQYQNHIYSKYSKTNNTHTTTHILSQLNITNFKYQTASRLPLSHFYELFVTIRPTMSSLPWVWKFFIFHHQHLLVSLFVAGNVHILPQNFKKCLELNSTTSYYLGVKWTTYAQFFYNAEDTLIRWGWWEWYQRQLCLQACFFLTLNFNV